MYPELNTLLPCDLCFWAATTLAFRALLRKSHFTTSPHNLRWRDVSIYPDHLVLVIHTSKTDQFASSPHRIILNSSPGSCLCPVFWLAELARVQHPLESDFIFRVPVPGGLVPLAYSSYSRRLKDLAASIHLDPSRVSPHSLRHGGASYMSSLGSDMIDIRAKGGWASSAVHTYLHHSDASLRFKDTLISSDFY